MLPFQAVSQTVKVVLLVVGALALLGFLGFVAAGVAGWLWLEDNAETISERSREARQGGAAFGLEHSTDECVDAALERVDGCGTLELHCHVVAGDFLSACLDTATRSEGFCDGVPRPSDALGLSSWGSAFCHRHHRPGQQGCINISTEIPRYCGG